ncbi:molybdopterin-dependent oxidoreductase [Sulfolobus sp. E5-1-F]|uniref:sulfite oxidase-like oxidoreductase n=1 Tax=Saccharolobus sp. E5-1-F TaxID=2663019 RepID=UPI001296B0DB|nr:sulfite oxidase-like oxidoreductase [Sulfolobus sp. E5-1-F]QGA55203.1 molybdopterin-dependent oxidoreductase [Sulfolobus sp. E5-1-F]
MQEVQKPPNQKYIKNFIIYAEFGIPEVNLESYRLKVSGEVENPLSFTYDELMKLPRKEIVEDFHCVTGWSIKNVKWEGIPFRLLIETARVKNNVNWVMFYSLDGYTSIIPYEDVLKDNVIVALFMNGEKLSLKHGFPARPIIPHLYGWKSAKWLTEIEFLRDYVDGYWEERGYHERGNVWEEERFKGQGGRHLRRRPVL